MKVRNMVKRLFAVGTGVAMLGATAMGALAADLGNYPDMFVKDGNFDGYFVVGENAASVDNIALTDITSGMKYTAADGASTVSVEGDAHKVGTSTNMLEFAENPYDVESYIGSEDLAALADGSITNNKGTSSYEQFLYFETNSATTSVPLFAQDDDENLALFYYVADADQIGRYYLEFAEALQSDWHATNYWKDIKDEQITMLGMTYDIVTATNTTTGPKLTLMGGSTKDTILEGDSKTFSVNDVEYDVSLLYTNTNAAKFTVNGESTDELAAGETDKLADGTIIGVTEVLYQAYAGGVHSATFFLGADKVELQNGSSLVVGDETYSESTVTIAYSESAGVMSIDSLGINMTADDDYYVAVGGKITDVMKTPDSLVGDWDLEFQGLAEEATEEIKFTPYSGDEKYKLSFTTSTGNEVSLPLLYTNSSANIFGGEKDDYDLVLNASDSITRRDYFVLNTASATALGDDSKTYVMQYKGRDSTADTDPKVTFSVLGGDDISRSLSTDGSFDIKIGGTTFNFATASANTTKNGAVRLTDAALSGYTTSRDAGNIGGGGNMSMFMRTSNNVEISVTNTDLNDTASDWTVDVFVDDTDRMNGLSTGTAQHVIYTFAGTTPDVDATIGSTAETDKPFYWVSNPDNDNENLGYDKYGTYVTQLNPDSGSKTHTLLVPDTQKEALLYVTSGATASTSVSGGTLTAVNTVDATKLDSEVADITMQNLIVVGGPCVNSVAAELMGNPADCAEGFTPGKARVKLIANGDYMAMLVAGYSGADTRLAGSVIAHRAADLTGMEVEVEGTSYATATIGAPTVMEEVVVEEPVVEEPVVDETTTE
jgi:hypothetical protein